MLISYKNKFIFIHNYKVAGTSITRALEKYSLADPLKFESINKRIEKIHLLVRCYNFFTHYYRKATRGKKINPKLLPFGSHNNSTIIKGQVSYVYWNEFFKFGFVRNPWDWQVSLYYQMLKDKKNHQHNLVKSMKNFDEYIRWRVKEDLHLQKEFFYDKDGNCMVDYIGKFENLEKDFNEVCRRIGVNAKLPHSNKGKRRNDYRDYYTKETKKLVEEGFKEDIKLFGYEF
jgi:hypothetical protein